MEVGQAGGEVEWSRMGVEQAGMGSGASGRSPGGRRRGGSGCIPPSLRLKGLWTSIKRFWSKLRNNNTNLFYIEAILFNLEHYCSNMWVVFMIVRLWLRLVEWGCVMIDCIFPKKN